MVAMRWAFLGLVLLAGLARADTPDTVQGFGTDTDAAWNNALEEAQRLLRKRLHAELGEIAWSLDGPAFARTLLRETGAVQEVGPASRAGRRDPLSGAELYLAEYRVTLTPEYVSKVRALARAEGAGQRQVWLGKVLVGILLALLLFSGYLRLNEWSGGRATRLLRVAVVVVLALLGLTFWLIG